MGNYIINPMWIYLANVANGAKVLLVILAFALVAGAVFFLICAADNDSYSGQYKELAAKQYKSARKFFIGAIIAAVVATILPTKETCIEIIAAMLATKENVALTVEGLKELILFIAEVLK